MPVSCAEPHCSPNATGNPQLFFGLFIDQETGLEVEIEVTANNYVISYPILSATYATFVNFRVNHSRKVERDRVFILNYAKELAELAIKNYDAVEALVAPLTV